jgi:hypothetical protein
MAERIVSPGVFTRENDLSFLAQGIGEIGAAFIGPFKQGPAFVPTIVRTQSEFEQIFGTPDGTYYTEYAVQNYLREAGVATIVRVAGIGGYEQANPIAIFASGSDNVSKLITTLHSTAEPIGDEEVGFTVTSIANASQSLAFSLNASFGQISSSLSPTSVEDVSDVFGESPFGSKTAYVYTYFENAASGIVPNTNAISASVLPTQDFLQDTQVATTPWVKSQLFNGSRQNLFCFHTLGHGTTYNTKYKVSISNVKAAGEDGSTDYSVFTVTIRSFADTDKRKVVLETYNNVNLDPASPNYIARVIGDRNATIDANGKITETGDYANKSRYVRVEVAELDSFPISSAPFAHGAYTGSVYLGGNEDRVPAVVYQTGSVLNTTSSPIYFAGIDLETAGVKIDNHQYLKPIPASATVGANVDFGFDSQLTYQMTGSNSADMIKRQFTLAFQGGFDGMSPATRIAKAGETGWGNSNTQGFNLSTSTSSGTIAYSKAIAAISNADEYDINMVVTPGVIRSLHPIVTTQVIDMVEARQDCFYIADFTDYNEDITVVVNQASAVDSNYAATYYPWVKTIDNNTSKLTSVPPSVLMPAVFASNDRLAAEWFAPAGLNRGGIVGAVSVLNRLTHSERDTLYENKVNPIASFPGQGIVAFGQKTLQDKASALDRINVRRLLITVKKYIASTSRFLVFEQNTAQTRNRFLNTANPYLEGIQQRQGLYAFRVVMDETNNTPDVIDRNILAGQIFLQPAKTAEFIVIDFNILPTGASFSA